MPNSLENLIAQHKLQNVPFEENELWLLLKGAVSVSLPCCVSLAFNKQGLAKMQQMNIAHQSIRPSTISVKADKTVKISDPTVFNSISSFAAVVQDFAGSMKGHYLSPSLVKERKFR